jgi:hypothetical protein
VAPGRAEEDPLAPPLEEGGTYSVEAPGWPNYGFLLAYIAMVPLLYLLYCTADLPDGEVGLHEYISHSSSDQPSTQLDRCWP